MSDLEAVLLRNALAITYETLGRQAVCDVCEGPREALSAAEAVAIPNRGDHGLCRACWEA